MTEQSLALLAKSYLRMIALAKGVSRLPLVLAYPLMHRLGRRYAPYRGSFASFENFAQAISLPASVMPVVWQQILRQHGMFFVNHFLHRASAITRIERCVHAASPEWQAFRQRTGAALVLTCHHDFYHTLLVLTGRANKRVHFVAAPEDSGPLAQWLLPHIRQQHAYCEPHFNGGRYLFSKRREQVRSALLAGDVVFSMHDFLAPVPGAHRVSLLGKVYEVPAGTLEIALELGVPVYFSVLRWSDETSAYSLDFQRLEVDPAHPLDAYAQAMETLIVSHPSVWHGWQWFDHFSNASV